MKHFYIILTAFLTAAVVAFASKEPIAWPLSLLAVQNGFYALDEIIKQNHK